MDLHDVSPISASGIRTLQAAAASVPVTHTISDAIRQTLYTARECGPPDYRGRNRHASTRRWPDRDYSSSGAAGLED